MEGLTSHIDSLTAAGRRRGRQDERSHAGPPQTPAGFLKQAGIARFGEAREIADALAFALSPAARWMTGTVLRVDGDEAKSV